MAEVAGSSSGRGSESLRALDAGRRLPRRTGRPERGVRCTLGEACRTPPCLGTCAHLHAGRGLLNPSLPLRLCREGFYMQQDAEECWGAILISLRDKLKVRHQTAATPLLAPLAAAPAARGMAL